MAIKRKRDDASANDKAAKKHRKGFQVGPDNLPDGQHKRKAQQIKRNLIEKAKLKKDYAKVKSRELLQSEIARPTVYDRASASPEPKAASPSPAPVSNEPHPERQNLIEEEKIAPLPDEKKRPALRDPYAPRERRPRPIPFAREHQEALRRKEEAEERRKAREAREKEREKAIEDRERFRKAMAKARTGGKNGQRKLGRESQVLLEKVQRVVGRT